MSPVAHRAFRSNRVAFIEPTLDDYILLARTIRDLLYSLWVCLMKSTDI